MRGPEQVEIRRRILHKNFHNQAQDMPEEVFIVSRQAMEQKGAVVLNMLAEHPGFKKEAMKVFASGYCI